MTLIKNLDTFTSLREQAIKNLGVRGHISDQTEFIKDVVVCGGTGCRSAKSQDVFHTLQTEIKKQGLIKVMGILTFPLQWLSIDV